MILLRSRQKNVLQWMRIRWVANPGARAMNPFELAALEGSEMQQWLSLAPRPLRSAACLRALSVLLQFWQEAMPSVPSASIQTHHKR